MTAHDHSLAQLLDASAQWWEAAGVDLCFSDEPATWLQQPVAPAAPRAAEPKVETERVIEAVLAEEVPAAADLLGGNPPSTLADFRQLWLNDPALHPAPVSQRVAPRGTPSPELMVLVLEPEPEDTETLLSGPQGALMAQILRAMGFRPEAVYFASALPAHTPMADPAALEKSGLGEVLVHHINLVKPQAIAAFGGGLAPLLTPDRAGGEMSLRENKHSPLVPPVLQSEALGSLIAMPRLKARFWRRWIEWSAQNS